MKKQLFAFMFAVAMFTVLSAVTAWGQTSQTIKVEVPFAFTANNKVQPAGSYSIEPVGDSRAVWRIRGSQHQPIQFLLASSLTGSSSGDLHVTVHRYGDQQFLAGFKTQSYEISLPTSRSEKMVLMAHDRDVPTEVIDLKTVTGGSR